MQVKLQKIRMPEIDLKNLRIGVLGNVFEEGDEKITEFELDLTNVGNSIVKTLAKRGYDVSFFDMNEYPDTTQKIIDSKIDIMFNVCERINNSSLLEPHSAALLDMLKIPYTGSNPFTLALCTDKIKTKQLLEYHNIPTPKWDYAFSTKDSIRKDLKYPLIVKPANTDSSIGITNESVVQDKKELNKQLKKVIIDMKRPALIEEYIEGDEIDVGIIGNNEELKVLPVYRSIYDDFPQGYWHIFSYDAKRNKGKENICNKIKLELPARIPNKLAARIKKIALDTYNIFNCHDYGRVEIRVDKENNLFVLEINPNPSIEEDTAVSDMAKTIGLDYGNLLEFILKNAIKRYKEKPPYHYLMPTSDKKFR